MTAARIGRFQGTPSFFLVVSFCFPLQNQQTKSTHKTRQTTHACFFARSVLQVNQAIAILVNGMKKLLSRPGPSLLPSSPFAKVASMPCAAHARPSPDVSRPRLDVMLGHLRGGTELEGLQQLREVHVPIPVAVQQVEGLLQVLQASSGIVHFKRLGIATVEGCATQGLNPLLVFRDVSVFQIQDSDHLQGKPFIHSRTKKSKD